MLTFYERVKNAEDRLTELEEGIVDYVLKHQTAVSQEKIASLASQFYTVPNTISRLVHKLGYESFSEFRHALKAEVEEQHYKSEQEKAILKNLELARSDKLTKIAEQISKAKAVNFYASDQTGLLTKLAVQSFYALDDKFQFYDYEKELRRRMSSKKDEVFFLVSMSGETQSVLDLAVFCKEQGHRLISLTNLTDNPLSRLADEALYCLLQEEEINGYDVTDKTALMIILEALFRKCCVILHEKEALD
ncbi:MurR/RpiR family transcriptional regulator [Lactococcus termiticola]|uniref:RpiR family transcriptional regulator n=1 Tax=Lactococcus termiticola TaxID=2169526 RepID=A0A2R5HGF5_9LACT|nr:MurR/RpiR family transcriptional regulator [Lactococcus termiticola]GBG97143.1 RpiR family transcriptional regulator [Lactococcus termiticola]